MAERKKSEKMYTVTVKAQPEAGFRRCGRHWPRAETTATVDEKTFFALKAEPKLLVIETDPEDRDPGEIINGVPVPTIEQVLARGYSQESAEVIVAEQKKKAAEAGAKARPSGGR